MASEPLASTAPPAYTEREDEGQHVQQPPEVAALPPSAYAYAAYPVGTAAIPGAAIPMQYMIPSGAGFQTTAPPQKSRPAPHNFLILAIITTVVCGMLNVLLSLGFGIPALILATMSTNAKRNGNYPKAKRYADQALALIVTNVVVTLCITLLITGLVASYSSSRFENRNKCLYIEYFAHLRRWYCQYHFVWYPDELVNYWNN